jgi:GntR family transcriptional regulator/MocR family aminotransferase
MVEPHLHLPAPAARLAVTRTYSYPAWNLHLVDRTSATPIHEQIRLRLQRAIVEGVASPGTRLPPSRTLAAELGVGRNTVVTAYELLAAEGYVRQRKGSGTFVADRLPDDYRARPSGTPGPASAKTMAFSARGREASRLGNFLDRTFGYDLSPLLPAVDSFPFEQFRRLSQEYWQRLPAEDLVYGEPGGLMKLRVQIAEYLRESRGMSCDADQIILCCSTLQAAGLAAMLLLEPGDGVIVEDPGHVNEIMMLRTLGVEPVSVRCDRSGLDLRTVPPAAEGARMVIVTPVGQFPLGSHMGANRTQAILDWAVRNDAWVLEDDYNSEYRWSGTALPPLAATGAGGHVLYTSSFHRALGPGFRLAYLVVPHDLIDGFLSAQQTCGFHAPLPVQDVVAEFMRRGLFARHLRRHRLIYQERAGILVECLSRRFAGTMDIPSIETGLHMATIMKVPLDDVAVSNAALRYNLDVPALSPFCLLAEPYHGFLIGFGNTPASRIPRSVANLARAIELVGAAARPG